MNDIPNWVVAIVSLTGSVIGAYVAGRVATTRLETQMTIVQSEIERLRKTSHRHASKVQWAVTAVEILLRHAKIEIPSPKDDSE